MKKITLGLIATILLSLNGYSQTKSISENSRLKIANAINSFVLEIKPIYQKGESFDSFSKKINNSKSVSKDGQAILNKTFEYIKNNASEKDILTKESGIEIVSAFNNYKLLNTKMSFEEFLTGHSSTSTNDSIWRWLERLCCNMGICCMDFPVFD